MITRQGDLDSLVMKKKRELGAIPSETCPDVDDIISMIEEFVPPQHQAEGKEIMERLRNSNASLRHLGQEWYEFSGELCAEADNIIKDLESEIRGLEDEVSTLKNQVEALEYDLKEDYS